MNLEKQNLILDSVKTVYFIGIGGIGMSALARYFKSKGVAVFGSDRDLKNETVKKLIAEGFEVYDQKQAEGLPKGIDLVVKTLAIPADNLELKSAQEKNIPIFNYAEILGEISKSHFTIAVSGTHGKTTTTAMTFEIAKNLGLDPTVIVGSFLNNKPGEKNFDEKKSQTNFVAGRSDLFIVEACEYGRSFLNLSPNILIITNLEADHLDYYRDLDDLKQAFYDLALKLPANGKIICNISDPNLEQIIKDFRSKIVNYSDLIDQINLDFVFGRHNEQNGAAAVCAVREYLQINNIELVDSIELKSKEKTIADIDLESKLLQALKSFPGTWRRMEYKGVLKNGVKVYDDYAHHPTEVSATLNAFKKSFPNKKIAIFFGPHQYSRTKMFFNDFVVALSLADLIFIYPIFRARAEEDYGVSAEILVEAINLNSQNTNNKISQSEIKTAKFVPDFETIINEIGQLNDEWIVILLGAGEVYQVAEKLDLSI